MIISMDAGKSFDKIHHQLMIKTKNRGKLPQLDAEHLQKHHS